MERSPPRHPAVPYALALLGGVVLGQCGWIACPWPVPVGVGAAAVVAWVVGPRRWPVSALAVVASIALGGWTAHQERMDSDHRIAGWLPADGTAVEIELVGEVLRVPEIAGGDERVLQIEARPTGPSRGTMRAARVILTVRCSPPAESGRIWNTESGTASLLDQIHTSAAGAPPPIVHST